MSRAVDVAFNPQSILERDSAHHDESTTSTFSNSSGGSAAKMLAYPGRKEDSELHAGQGFHNSKV